jgi:hypothetical protein
MKVFIAEVSLLPKQGMSIRDFKVFGARKFQAAGSKIERAKVVRKYRRGRVFVEARGGPLTRFSP